MAPQPDYEYDSYQLKLQVNLSEEDSCLYSRYGISLFNIQVCDSIPSTPPSDSPTGIVVVIPDAVILNIDIDRCDRTKAVFSIYVRLPAGKKSSVPPVVYVPPAKHTFCITSGSSGQETKLITFNVGVLDKNVTSAGIFDQCYTYVVSRVPERLPIPVNGYDFVNGKLSPGDDDGYINYVPDILRITLPMTKETKSLIPDFGLSGAYFNSALGTVGILVRLVSSCGSTRFCIPAKLFFDKEKCTVCLEISAQFIVDASRPCSPILNGYEHRFECCDNGSRYLDLGKQLLTIYDKDEYKNEGNDPEILWEKWMTLGNTLFQTLAQAKKIDVTGINKCAESILFSFQVCYLPYRGFTIDYCDQTFQTEVNPDLPTIKNTGSIGPETSFIVEACGEYSYEFYSSFTNTPIS